MRAGGWLSLVDPWGHWCHLQRALGAWAPTKILLWVPGLHYQLPLAAAHHRVLPAIAAHCLTSGTPVLWQQLGKASVGIHCPHTGQPQSGAQVGTIAWGSHYFPCRIALKIMLHDHMVSLPGTFFLPYLDRAQQELCT